MSIQSLDYAKELREIGRQIGRAGMSERVMSAVAEWDGSYKGAMRLAGRLKAISQMANCDEYWREQIGHGFHQELRSVPSKAINQESGE